MLYLHLLNYDLIYFYISLSMKSFKLNKKIIFLAILISIAFLAYYFISAVGSKPIDFSSDIKPILNNKCITCHGGVKKSGGFSLLFEEEAFANTASGKPAIIRGNASQSLMIQLLKEEDSELRMPYEKPPLTEREIDLLTKWIDEGAKWGEHWAYSLPEKVSVPENQNISENNFIKNEIDYFILEKLETKKLSPSAVADSCVLIRRVALDLTGLPPDKELFDSWKNGTISYQNIVDTLLSKKTYGEKWATWWLDLARYADTKGYEKDKGRTIWRYRDWVINAFNSNMPYDKFTTEQLAGDLLPEPSVDQLIATAFQRNTMNNDEGGTEDEEFRTAAVMDRVNTTFEVFQSTTIGCVQCHSHPYDPFKYEEYYKLMGFYNNTRDEDTPGEEPTLKFYNSENLKTVDSIINWARKYGGDTIAKKYNDFLLFNEPIYQGHHAVDFKNGELDDTKWLALRDNGSCVLKNVDTQEASYMYLNYWAGSDGTTMTVKENDVNGVVLAQFKIDKTKGRIIRRVPFKKLNKKIDLYFEVSNNKIDPQRNTSSIVWFGFIKDLPAEDQKGYTEVDNSIVKLLNTNTTSIPIMAENPDYMARANQIFERGNWTMKGDTIAPGTPSILNAWEKEWPRNRLGLSNWIVSKKNPLTARTFVNRVWHQLFGRGLVASLEDMGTQSELASHPELLDWLALRFMHEHNWDIKALIKDIVMSGTYRQSSISSAQLYEIDPENSLYARGPRFRLNAEQIRDQALAISGLLSKKMYGPGVMPPQPDGVWQSVYTREAWVESKGEDKFRRAIYTYLKRTSPYPSFMTFDAVSREVCTVRRTITNTPLQALVTLNDPVYQEIAYNFAKKMSSQESVEKSIAWGYQKATYTKISNSELLTLKELYNTSLSAFNTDAKAMKEFFAYSNTNDESNAHLAALSVVANAIMNLDEFLTKS